MNATVRADTMIDLLEDLIAVLERENVLLDRPRAKELEPVVEEKLALFRLYDEELNALAQDPDFAAALPEDVHARLTKLAETFEETMCKNRRRLELMVRSSRHIVNRIVEAAKEATGQTPRYGRGGTVAESRAAAPVVTNQKV